MLTLHFAPGSRAERILWLLHELELPHELNAMRFHPADLKTPEHRARHPLGRVPVLDDGNVRIFESGAIVEYLLTRHGGGRMRPAVDDAAYPDYLQWLHYCEGIVMPPINTITVETILLPPEKRTPVILARAQRLLTKSLAPLDARLSDREWMAGDFSGADIMLGHAAAMSDMLGQVPDEMANLKAYVERVKARPAYQKTVSHR